MNSLESTLSEARPFLRTIVSEAGAIVLHHFRRPLETRKKVGHDIVTTADFESEAFVANAIRDRFPSHSLVAEEGAVGAEGSEYRWSIDPLDGTVNYASGVPAFAVAICLAHRGDPVLGAILDPSRNELFWAERGAGATKNGERIRVSEAPSLSESLVYVSTFGLRRPALAPDVLRALASLGPATRNVVNLGSAGIAWAYTACGYFDAEVSFAVDQYTGPAGILLVREAGGRATDFEGADWAPGVPQVVASNGHIHDELLGLLACRA